LVWPLTLEGPLQVAWWLHSISRAGGTYRVSMDKQLLTRRGLFVLGLVAIGGRAFASGDEGHDSGAHGRHCGYKVGGGLVLMVMAAVAASMVVFGELRRPRAKPPLHPATKPSPPFEEADRSALDDQPTDETAERPPGPRQRRVREPHP
jgi:hypothetical protein